MVTKKEVSVQHENFIARLYDGERDARSGGGDVKKGDVRIKATDTIFECKATGAPGGDSKYTKALRDLEKVADEAWAEGKIPALALRYFCPDSPLSSPDGWVDLVVRLASDDFDREQV